MSCSPDRVKDYFFGELNEPDGAALRAHLAECTRCREEYEALHLTQAALRAVPDEEPPRRTAFVSDKVFEPGWWQKLWQSGPRLGFASAALLALAVVFHAAWRPAPVVAPQVDQAAIQAQVQAALADAEARYSRKTAQAVEAARKEFEFQQQADRIAIQSAVQELEKKFLVAYKLASNYEGGRP
jgi:hypothetical protein